jgi:hypothetical protein
MPSDGMKDERHGQQHGGLKRYRRQDETIAQGMHGRTAKHSGDRDRSSRRMHAAQREQSRPAFL